MGFRLLYLLCGLRYMDLCMYNHKILRETSQAPNSLALEIMSVSHSHNVSNEGDSDRDNMSLARIASQF